MNSNRYFLLGCALFAALLVSAAAQQAGNPEVVPLNKGGMTYFTAKMDRLTEKLSLTADQQAKLKPIAMQETGLLEEIRENPGLSSKEKWAKLQQIVQASDKQMKPWLSDDQWQKLQALRKDQKSRLQDYAKQK